MRSEGRSVKEIARLVRVSVSSVSYWVRDVPLTAGQRAELDRRMSANGRAVAAAGRSKAAREVRCSYQEHGRRLAQGRIPLHLAGCMLYWAEGSKSRNSVQFVNSDPMMVQYFIEFLRAHYEVPDEAIRVDCTSSRTTQSASTRSNTSGWTRWTFHRPARGSQRSTSTPSTARRNARTDSHTERCAYASTRRG